MGATVVNDTAQIRTLYRALSKCGAISLDRQKMLGALIQRQKEDGNTLEDAIARLDGMGRDEVDASGQVVVKGVNREIISDSIAWVRAHW